VQNNWGGPSSADKRDWFGGAISEYVAENPEADEVDVEAMLAQVMLDEFEVAVDDGSAAEVADAVVRVRGECGRGDFRGVEEMRRRWEGVRGERVVGQEVEGGSESESESEEEEDADGDIEMGEPEAPREKPAPQIDEDGFETVVSRRKR
jgi:pre-rRNA-processing protein TSR2